MESYTASLHEPLAVASETERKPRARRLTRERLGRTLLLVVLACVGAGLGYLRAWPPLATVMSSSMAPTIDTGDIVILKRLQGPPRVGDVIAVSVPETARARYGYPPQVIHRITKIAPNGEITTKGDARKKPDPFTVSRASVEAEVAGSIPAIGRVLAFLTSTLGLLWIGAGIVLFALMPLIDRHRERTEREREGVEALSTELRGDLQAVLEELVRLQAGVGAEARARQDLERRIAELIEVAQRIPEREVAAPEPEPVAEPVPEKEPVPEPDPDPEVTVELVLEPEPEPFGVIEPWTNVFSQPREPRHAPASQPPAPAATQTVRRRSGGLLARLR